jgi:predicted Zn-dependent peptidase
MEFEIIRLENGLRVAFSEDRTAHTVHCGFFINAGSRDEMDQEQGLAHLIEHCLFKGTKKRKAFHILTRLDSVGGEINAYTSKEETCIYASALKEHFGRASELLFDIVFSPNFPEKEIVKEISVVKDEINSYKDSPDEQIQDEFEERLFPNHPLGRSILGREDILESQNKKSIENFVDRLYSTDEIVFACVGNVSRKQLDKFCQLSLATIPAKKRINSHRTSPISDQFHLTKKDSVHQIHALLGGQTVGINDDRRRQMFLLNNILGGPAMNSRLNLNIREKFGFCYYIESSFNPYTDLGIFQVYFGTDKRHFAKTEKLIRKELDGLMQVKLNARSLLSAQKQLIAQIALAQEQRANLMLSVGKSLLHFDSIDTFSGFEEKIMGIDSESIQDMAQNVFSPANLSSLAYLPEK